MLSVGKAWTNNSPFSQVASKGRLEIDDLSREVYGLLGMPIDAGSAEALSIK